MSPEGVGFLGILILLILLFARMWIALAMAFVAFFGILYLQGFPQALEVLGSAPYTFISNYSFTTLPMFVLMGNVIAATHIGDDLYYAAHKWVGHLRGGLGIATTLACALLGAIAGVSMVAVMTMGKVALPEMRRHGYSDSLATSSIACAGTLAFLIPPSVPFILYGILTEQSVGLLFIAGILPGVLLIVLFIITILIITTLRPEAGPAGPKARFREKIISLKGIWPMLLLFILVLGGIYMGFFTPTEGGAVGAGGATIIGLLSRRLSLKDLRSALIDTGQMTAMVLLVMMGVAIFMRFIAISKVTFLLTETIGQFNIPPVGVLACIVVLYIILGMFMDIIASIMLTVPILFPVIVALGFDPIWFGVILVLLIQVGLVSPPVGLDVFILSGITHVPAGIIFRGVWPFCAAVLVAIIIITIFPKIALFLPSLM
jgi:tripartite ATP-independent transporter DctM subunit